MPSSLLPSFSLFCFLLSFVFIFLFTISLFSFLFSHLSFSIVAPQLPIFPDSPLFIGFPLSISIFLCCMVRKAFRTVLRERYPENIAEKHNNMGLHGLGKSFGVRKLRETSHLKRERRRAPKILLFEKGESVMGPQPHQGGAQRARKGPMGRRRNHRCTLVRFWARAECHQKLHSMPVCVGKFSKLFFTSQQSSGQKLKKVTKNSNSQKAAKKRKKKAKKQKKKF